jgi:hypothetical protein
MACHLRALKEPFAAPRINWKDADVRCTCHDRQRRIKADFAKSSIRQRRKRMISLSDILSILGYYGNAIDRI